MKAKSDTLVGLFRLVRFVLTRPLLPLKIMRDARKVGIYSVRHGKHRLLVILPDSIAGQVITNRADNQPVVQYVWRQAQYEVAVSPELAGVKVPDLHVWRNVARNGKYVVRVQRVRCASRAERKQAGFRPLHDVVRETWNYLTAA